MTLTYTLTAAMKAPCRSARSRWRLCGLALLLDRRHQPRPSGSTSLMSPLTITFPPADPDTRADRVLRCRSQLTYRVRQNNNQPWTLTLLADGRSNFRPVHRRYLQRQLDRDAGAAVSERHAEQDRRAAARRGCRQHQPDDDQGQITFRLANSWNYTAGLYTQTIVFTLTAP